MSCCKRPFIFFMMLLVFMISSHIQNNCCKHHIIAPTGFEPIKLFAVKNTDMFRRFSVTDNRGSGKGWIRTINTYLVMGRMIAVEATNMAYILLLLYQLSYLAIFTAYNGQSLQQKSNWVEFHIHRKKVY